MNADMPFILDDLLDVIATRPPRVLWVRPRNAHPVFIECATALRNAGYVTVTGVSRDGAYLVARYRLHEAQAT